jgi:hypothetical protein
MQNSVKSLVNWHKVSLTLSGNGGSVRSNVCPAKYEPAINELLELLEGWEAKYVHKKPIPKKFTPEEVKEILEKVQGG